MDLNQTEDAEITAKPSGDSFESDLADRSSRIKDQDLWRQLNAIDSPQGRTIRLDQTECLNFSSNDYLGLASHPELVEAATEAMSNYGFGAGASRLICGSMKPFHELEEDLAEFKKTEAALVFSSGYATALGVLPAIMGKDDLILADRLVHACVIDGARLCGADFRVFPHNDLERLYSILKRARDCSTSKKRRILIVTESIFSMDGDKAPLLDITELKDRFGAWLMVDEAHAVGVLGETGGGLIQELKLEGRVEIQMGTLGKALGASGGYVAGRRSLVEFLINRSRSFIFSTAPSPSAAAAARKGLYLARSSEGAHRRLKLWQNQRDFLHFFSSRFPECGAQSDSAIVPIRIGNEKRALMAAEKLRNQGIFLPAIRFPTVAKNTARLRATLTSEHTKEDVAGCFQSIKSALEPIR